MSPALPPLPPSAPPHRAPHAPARRRRGGLHLALFLATTATMVLAGSLIESIGELVADPPGVLLSYLTDPSRLWSGVPLAVGLLAVLGAHEMGHYLACRYYGIPATLPYFIPGPPPFGTFGAVIRIRGVIPDRRALFDVAAAGPLAGYAVALPLLVAGLLRAEPLVEAPGAGFVIDGEPLVMSWLLRPLLGLNEPGLDIGAMFLAGWFGMLVTSMNLFPVGQLDGGHVAYAWSRRLHRRMTRITLVAVAALVVAVPLVTPYFSLYTVWLLILLWMRDRHPPLLREDRPLGRGRRLLALVLLVIFATSFIPVPFLYVII